MAIGVEAKGESFGLLVDAVGEVLKLADDATRAKSCQSRSAAGRARRPASTASMGSFWSCSTSTACSTSCARQLAA